MTAPQEPPMRPKTLCLRVFSVRRTTDQREPQEPTPQTWEVRAETDLGVGKGRTTLFYSEVDPRNLPPLESLIYVTVEDQLTCREGETTTDAPVETTYTNPDND